MRPPRRSTASKRRATYGPLLVQGEYFWFNVERNASTGLPPIGAPNLKFDGGYAQASYVLTGESHPYNAASASYGGVVPMNPFSLSGGGWGAWEIAGRVQHDRPERSVGSAVGVAGGGRPSIRWR